MERYICIHGHFYQPPRENPWLEEVELQDSAFPYHDWNERITSECYAPNTASRILDDKGRIIEIVNIYSKISFNFGPTLLSWMEKHGPDIYDAVIEADRLSRKRFSGHGSALAQVYNHMIMPLANKRGKYTQVYWGIKDFEKRFKRVPEGMWLAETAVDIETLEVMVELGIRFTILAPNQAGRVKRIHESDWLDVSEGTVDPTMPYICYLPSGKSIFLFFYDGPISRDTAFGDLLKSGEAFAQRLTSVYAEHRDWPQIVHIATDGETYGHHQRRGDMALAYCLHHIESKNLAKLTNYGEYLAMHPPSHEVDIIENSSWSCIHGIERWRDNCGCHTGMNIGWTQAWRRPLRNALDRLRDGIDQYYEEEASRFLEDPWDAMNDYIHVILDRRRKSIESFFMKHTVRELSPGEKGRVLKLLEIQRNAMLMYTSCGWFFDEVSGIETVQVMQYAARAIQYLKDLSGPDLEPEFMGMMEEAPSNVYANAAQAYEQLVKTARVDLFRVGAHYGISSIFEEYPEDIKIFCYSGRSEQYDRMEAGRVKLVTGTAKILSDITWDEKILSFAVLHLGDQNINGGVRDFIAEQTYKEMHHELKEAFEKGDIPDVIRRMDKHFGHHTYNLWHLFRDEQRKILTQVLQLTYEGIEASYRQIYEHHYTIMSFFNSLQAPIPRPFSVAVEYIVNIDLKRIFQDDVDVEKLENLISEIRKWNIVIEKAAIGYAAGEKINSLMENLSSTPEDVPLIEKIKNIVKLLRTVPMELDLWKAQNIYFSIGRQLYGDLNSKAEKDDTQSKKWIETFRELGFYLGVKAPL